METAPLKSFATAARTELIREVGARITAVLAQGSPERVEQPKAVTALERAIAAAGGGDRGKTHVADKVAYTWFNRIIALRFMDANGYTGIGVVSPATDQVGQPEVLAAANDTPFGLAGYFYSQDVRRIWRMADALETGIVGINEGAISAEAAPFGGVKESGYGREGSVHGLEDYLHTKYICQGQLD